MSDTFADRDIVRQPDRNPQVGVNDQRQAGLMAKQVNLYGFTTKEKVAVAMAAIMTIGPLFAAFYGRTFG